MRLLSGRFAFSAILLVILALPAWGDWKMVTKVSDDGQSGDVRTEYRQGGKLRIEYEPAQGARSMKHRTVYIRDSDQHLSYLLDLQTRQYVERGGMTANPLSVLAAWIRRTPKMQKPTAAVDIYREVIDTGERQQMFGHMARHLIRKERTVAEPGACLSNSERVVDGWYISLPEQPGLTHGGFTLQSCTATAILHGDKNDPGVPLMETVTVTDRTGDGSSAHGYSSKWEVVELSEHALDPKLFEPPKDFTRTDALSREPTWTQQWEAGWVQLEQALESWFE